jgi:preprotein translocase subunit SecF
MRPLRLVPDGTRICFMRGRFAGLIVSAVLSVASIVLFFHPGLNYSIDFTGGVVIEFRAAARVAAEEVRHALSSLHLGEVKVQGFGSPRDVLIRLEPRAGRASIQQEVRRVLQQSFAGSEVRRMEVVGSKVSAEMFHDALLATSLALLAILAYVWFRFDWQFGVGVVATLLLDATKTVGFFAVTRIAFDLNSVAALLILIGYSVTDKVVVYDRIRENLRKFKRMKLRELIDLSINQTLSRTVATSLTVLLSILPLAFMGGESVQGFAETIIFGIVVGTSSSIFIASPILLFLGGDRLRRDVAGAEGSPAGATSA